MLAGVASAVRSSVLSFHEQADASPVAMFSRRYWLYGLLFSSQIFLCSPASDHVMPVTSLIVVHSSRFVLRAFTVKLRGCSSYCV